MKNDLLIQLLDSLKTDVINAMQAHGKDLTGHTAGQITITEEGKRVTLQLPGYMQLLETGRQHTSPNAMPADPPMILRIRQWCRQKGIADKAAWAIKRAIDKKGYKGIPGLITSALGDENIEQRLTPVLDAIAAELSREIVNNLL